MAARSPRRLGDGAGGCPVAAISTIELLSSRPPVLPARRLASTSLNGWAASYRASSIRRGIFRRRAYRSIFRPEGRTDDWVFPVSSGVRTRTGAAGDSAFDTELASPQTLDAPSGRLRTTKTLSRPSTAGLAGLRVADRLHPVSARINQEGSVVTRMVDVPNARRTVVRPSVRHPCFPKCIYCRSIGRFETPMPRRSVIWLATGLDQQVKPVWMVPIAPLAVS